jgi:hypothetical protein
MSYALIKLKDKLNNITIENVLKLKDNNFSLWCPQCKSHIILRNGKINKPHFAHYSSSLKKCNFYYENEKNYESYIHKNAKFLLKKLLEERNSFLIHRKCSDENCNNIKKFRVNCIEENSSIIEEYEFSFNNSSNRRADIAWVWNDIKDTGNFENLACIFEICNTNPTQEENRPSEIPWFDFKAEEVIELLEKDSNNDIVFNCIRKIKCNKCAKIDNNGGVIYFNQRGAGCGKTFESVQLINTDRFKDKDIFIYLTKMHSVVNVIFEEFKAQEKNGYFENVELIEIDESNKKYRIDAKRKDGRFVQAYIGTMDSFTHAIADKNKNLKNNNDFFLNIVETITRGEFCINIIKNKKLSYGGSNNISFNNRCLIIIDESQDLDEKYIEAFDKIRGENAVDIYVIGDKLQSIFNRNNIYTCIDEKKELGYKIVYDMGKNICKRFHDNNFIDFVNKMINFSKYNLPQIEGICDRENSCGYNHNKGFNPITLFNTEIIYNKKEIIQDKKINENIEKIINYMEELIKKYDYIPNNFMFIFPHLKKNILAINLEMKLQDFWIKKYRSIVNNPLKSPKNYKTYWSNLDVNSANKFVFFHKSEEGQSINLAESEDATRIMSIHASKGNGREVVFLLGLSESTLKLYSKGNIDIVYESLLHVALTRQKEFLYIGVEKNNDDINRRLDRTKLEFEGLDKYTLNLSSVKKHIKFSNFKKFIDENQQSNATIKSLLIKIEDEILESADFKEKLNSRKDKKLLDWGHHTIRYAILKYQFLFNIWRNETVENGTKYDQFETILKKISNFEVIEYNYKDYTKYLKSIQKPIKNIDCIPILIFENNEDSPYFRYTSKLKKIIKEMKDKICHYLICEKIMPIFCPIEFLILMHIFELNQHGKFAEVSIMEIYHILYCYDNCSDMIDKNHSQQNKCICKEVFNSGKNNNKKIGYSDIRNNIKNHYENTLFITEIYENYKKNIDKKLIKNLKYNVEHKLNIRDKKDEFINLNDNFDIISHSDNNVIYFIFKPTFSHINLREIIIEILYKHFIITFITPSNNKTKNYEKFNDKNISLSIITCEYKEAIFIDNLDLKKYIDDLKQVFKEFIMKEYEEFHQIIIKTFEYFCNQNKLSCVENMLKEFEKDTQNKIPKYLITTFEEINQKLGLNKEKNIKTIDKFRTKLEIKLKEKLENVYEKFWEFIAAKPDISTHTI